jgi:phospholipid-binding lipoprotein MlaA
LTAAALAGAEPVADAQAVAVPPVAEAPPPAAAPASPAIPAPAFPAASAPAAPPPEPSNEIVVEGETKAPPQDPIERVNEKSFEVVQKVDDKLIAPIAHGYEKGVPRPVRMGLRNFIRNLTEPVVFINYMLQLKPGKAMETVGRFAVNSTIGVGGLVDVAKKKPFNLPYRPNGLGNTLGYYGVGPGPYLYLPLVGPTTVRDLFGLLVDRATVPGLAGGPLRKPEYVLPLNIVESIDDRLQIDADLQEMKSASNPYVTYRELYLQARRDEIEALHGRGPLAKGEIGVAPFPKPLHPEPEKPAVAETPAPPATPAPAPVDPQVRQPEAHAPAPKGPVFVSIPVVQPIPVQ